MAYSLLDMATSTRQQAMSGMRDVAQQEQQREAANKQLKEANQASRMQSIGMGAGLGAMVAGSTGAATGAAAGSAGGVAGGAAAGSVGGPMGAAIGAGIGLIASLF
jgi:hypothetical protein